MTLVDPRLLSEPTGQHTLALQLTNRGRSGCLLDGYPAVRLSDRAGAIPFVIRHGGDQVVTSHPPRRVLVRAGGHAFVVLNHYRCDLGVRRSGVRIFVGAPGATRAQSASLAIAPVWRGRTTDYCGRRDPGTTLTVSPFEPTLRAGF